MGILSDVIREAGRASATPEKSGALTGQVDSREQAIVDRYKSEAPKVPLFQDLAEAKAEREIAARKQQRAYVDQAPPEMVAPVKEMLSTLGDRRKTLEAIRAMTPEQREEALRLVPGIAQQLGDDRGNAIQRAGSAVGRGISHLVSQPLMELVGAGGTDEEIEYIRQLDAAASQEFNAYRPDDPRYQRGPLQATEMVPWMFTIVGAGGLGRAAATGAAGRVATSAAGGSKIAGAVQSTGQAIGRIPTKIPVVGKYLPAVTAGGAGGLAGITAAGFPGQYAQEVDALKAIGMEDGLKLRMLATGTAAIASAIEGIVPNPFKAGSVPLTQGATKAARQYLWEATKRAPAEMSEEFFQGVTSGLGEHVAQYIDENAEDKTVAQAFRKGWEQTKEAALPMAFLMGVPAVGGAGLSAARARRMTRLQETLAKGFVSTEDAKELGIEGKNRKERQANADAELKQLEQEASQTPAQPQYRNLLDFGSGEPQGDIPTPPGLALFDRMRDRIRGRSTQEAPPAPPVPPQIPGQPAVPQQGPPPVLPPRQSPGAAVAPPAAPSQQPATPPAPLPAQQTSDDELMVDWIAANPVPNDPGNRPDDVENWRKSYDAELAKRRSAPKPNLSPISDKTEGKEVQAEQPTSQATKFDSYVESAWKSAGKDGPVSDNYKQSQKHFVNSAADYGVKQGRVVAFDKGDGSTEMQFAAIIEELERRGYETGPIQKTRSQGVDNIEFSVTKKAAEVSPGGEAGAAVASKQPEATQKQPDVAERDEAEDELAGLFGEEETTEQPDTSGWDVIEGSDRTGKKKLYREDPNPNLTPSQRIATRVEIDPSEGTVLATKDQFGKPIPQETMAARQEFVDKAKPGAEFNIKGFETSGPYKVMDDGQLLDTVSNRVMGTVQSRANQVKPGDITWTKEQTTAPAPQQPKGGDPAVTEAGQVPPLTAETQTDTPTVSTENAELASNRAKAQELWDKHGKRFLEDTYKREGLKDTAADKKRKDELRSNVEGNLTANPKGVIRVLSEYEAKPAETTQPPAKQPESAPVQPPSPPKLGTKGAIKSARKMEPTEEGRPADGKPIIPGDRFVTNTGRETTPFPKYSGSSNRQVINADKKSQLWLIENAIAEAESRGDDFNLTMFRGELETASKGKLPQASKDSATLYVFGDYVPKVPKPITKPLVEKTSEMSPIGDKKPTEPQGKKPSAAPEVGGWKPFKPDVSITESPDLKQETSRRQKKDPGFPLDVGSPVTVYRRNKGRDEMQEGVVEDFADAMPANIKVRLNDGTLATPLVADVGPPQTKPNALDFSISGQSKPIPGMEDEEATYTVHARKPDVIPDTFSVVVAGKPRGKGWTTVKGTGMTAEEAYGLALTTFEGKRAEEPATGYAGLPQVSRAIFETAMQNSTPDSLLEILHSGNKNMRAEFELRTGIKLPATVKGTKQVVEQWFKDGKKPAETTQPSADQVTDSEAKESISEKSENVPARTDKSSELDSKPVSQPEGVGSSATNTGAALPASEQARENLRKRGKKKPSQADIDAETSAVIREREADNKVRQEFQSDRDAQKAQDARREFVGKQKELANPATVDSLGFGDIAQVNDDIERGRVSYEDATKVADEFVAAGYLPQGKRDQIRKPTQPSADQVNVDSGEDSKVKPEDELASLRAKSEKMYDEVERLKNTGKDREANALLREAEKLTPRIKELEAPLIKAKQDAEVAAKEESRKAYNAKEDARKAALPTKQTRNGWELATDGARWYLRDPNTKEIIYEGKLKRVREVADESPPDVPASTEPPKSSVAPDKAKETTEAEAKPSESVPPLPWSNSSPEDESKWYGTKINVAPANRREEPYTGQVVRVLNRGEMVEVQPDGQDGTFRVDSARITLAEAAPTVADKPSVEPAAEPLPDPAIPAFTRTTPGKGSATRQFQSERVEKARKEIADLERKARAKRSEHDGLRSNATKKRAAVKKEIYAINNRIQVVQGEIASDFAADTLAKLEDELESPRSYDHYLAGMKAIHKLKASVAEDAARRGEMGREAARAEVSKEQNEADRLDAELQGRAKDIAMSKGFTPGDADQIALSASNGFTVFEDRSLADIVEVQGARTRESRVSQEINKLKPSSPYGQQDLSTEQIAEFTKQYQEASLDDKNWLDKRKEVDKSVREAIQANRDAVRKREDEERKAKEAEKAKDDQERLANARERAKKYFLDERISKALKKQKPKTKPVKLRQEKAGGPVKIVDGKITDGDQSGELYPNGLILHKSFEEGSKDFVLTHARSGSGFPFSAKKSDMQELIGIIDLLGIDFNVDTDEKGALPSELTARVKKINNAWDNNDYSLLSDEDYATVQTLAETAKTDIDADLILTADDLGANGIPPGLDNVMTDKGLRIVKEMAIAVPEFAYDPVFTVKDGKLLYRDGYEFKLEPTAFNLHPSELKEGQTVGINLEDLGIKRATPQDVVAAMMTGAGLPRVTKNKGGDVSVGYVGAKPTSLEQGKDDSEWNVVGGTPKVQEMAVAVLKKIRWRQPGQDGDPKTDIDVVPADQPQAADDASQNVPAIQSEEVPTIDPFSERSPESAERRKLIAEAKNEMRPYYQIEPEIGVEEGIRNAINSFVAGTSDNARIIGGADGKALGYDGSTKQWNAIIKRAQSIADKTNAVQAVVAVGDTETGVPTHAVIISSPGFVGATFESQNTKPFAWGNTIEKLYDGLPSQIVMPEVAKQSIDSSAQAEAKYGNTPLGKLFAEAKAAGGDTMLFFRMGDFYELYFEDAQKAAKMLGLTLTTRDKSAENPIPMTGFPYHQLDGYLKKLKSAGIRVAVNEEPFAKPQAKAKAEQKTEPESASVPTQAEFMEMSNGVNAPGVKQTIRVTAGERTLLMERSKHDGEWSIREAEKYTGEVKGKTAVKKGGELIVSGIVETKKAKEIAQRIIDGTFDKDTDNRFVREDTQNIGLTNAGIAEAMKGALGGKRDSFAKLLLEKGLVTDGRFLMKVSDKDRDAILKSVGETFEGRDLSVVSKMLDDGQKALSRAANAMKPIGYRGGYLTSRTVVLQSQDGDSAILDKALHDTILKKYPSAVPYFLEDGKPVSYAIDGELVAIVMPMNMNKPDSTVKELVSGKYDFDAAAAEAAKFPPPQSKTKLKQAAEKANKELANAVDEFGKAIKGKLGMNLPLNPEVIAAAAKVVSKAIQAGTLNFSELMERMVAKYGEKMAERMRSVLRQEWDKQINSNPIAEDGIPPKTPQPHPELVQPEPIPLTSVKNAIVDELRVQRGEAPMPEVTPETVPQWLELAGNRIANDPYAGNTLVEQLLAGDKTSVDEVEGMVLQYHYRAVNNLFVEADIKLRQAKANGDPASIATAQDEARVIMRRLTAIETALDKAGTAWGRAGVSRQIFLKQDFSLSSMLRRARVANGGNELSDEQVAIISEQAKQIEELQKRIAELEAKTAEQEQAKVIDESIKKDIENIQSPPAKPKSRMRVKAEERVASALAMFGAAAKGKLYTNPIDPEILIPAIEVVKAYFDLGVVTFREFMSTIAKNIGTKEAKASKAIFRTAWDQLQTAGALSQPDLDLTNPGKLTRFARSVQRTLIENGLREREEIVDGVHEALQEIIPDITRRQAMDALSSYGQFSQLSKDPVDQIMRDINGQLQQLAKLDDMEQGIAPAKTGVERRSPSDEERRLAQMVNEATRRGGFVVTDPETQLKSAMAAAKTAVRNRIADMNYEIQTGSRIVRGKTELIPDAELEQLRKDRDALQKVHKEMFPPKGATQAQKIASASRALDAAIASLEAKLAVGDISPAPQPPPLSTPELDAKRARLKALNEQRNALRKIANPGMTDEQKKIRSLDKSIEELEKQLATGNFAPKPKSAPLTSPEINARQAKLEELRATKKAILAAANPKMTPEQRARKAYEASLRKQLAMYSEKIAQSDFAPTQKKSPRILTKTELDLKKQLADVKHDFFEALSKYHLANLSPAGRAIDIVRESAHLSRAIMTSMDLSAVLRQGGLGVYSHPVVAKKAAKQMWDAIWSREAEFQSMEKLRTRPNAQLYEESGLNITDSEGKLTRQEEAFMGRWARTGVDFAGQKVQSATKGLLEPVAASARAYVTFINNLRADLFDVMVENLGPGGQVTKEEARLIAKYVNVATGRADLKALNSAAANLNTVFFAPRYVASRFQYLAMPFYLLGTKDSGRVKKLIAQEYARTFTGAAVFIGTLTALAYLAAGGDDEEKPSVAVNPFAGDMLSSDFGKVRIGETRLDPLAGLSQVIVFSSRMVAFRSKSSETGKIKPFYEGGPYQTTHGSEAWRFLRTKLAPVPGAAVTAMSGMENVVGEDVTPAGLVGGLFIPLSAGEVISTMQHRGVPKGTALTILNILGASVNTYGPKTAYLDATPEERAKQVNDYIKHMDWESDLPAFREYLKPEELKQVQDRQNERRGDLVFEAMGEVKPKKDYKTEVHYEEALERHKKANEEFEEFRKQYAPTYTDALRYLTHHFDNEGGIKVQGVRKTKPSFVERKRRLMKYYDSLPAK